MQVNMNENRLDSMKFLFQELLAFRGKLCSVWLNIQKSAICLALKNNTKFSSEELPNNCTAVNTSLNYTGGTGTRGTTGTTPSHKVIVVSPTINMSEEN